MNLRWSLPFICQLVQNGILTVRRIVCITLLLLVGLPLISPLFAATRAVSDLPACCRRDGRHHCMMLSVDQTLTTGGAHHHFMAMHERCPFDPAAVQTTGVHLLSSPRPQAIAAALHNNCAFRITQAEALYRISFDRARQKRGPPL